MSKLNKKNFILNEVGNKSEFNNTNFNNSFINDSFKKSKISSAQPYDDSKDNNIEELIKLNFDKYIAPYNNEINILKQKIEIYNQNNIDKIITTQQIMNERLIKEINLIKENIKQINNKNDILSEKNISSKLQIFDTNKFNAICNNYEEMKKKNLDLSKILENHENIFNELNEKLENILKIKRENENDKKDTKYDENILNKKFENIENQIKYIQNKIENIEKVNELNKNKIKELNNKKKQIENIIIRSEGEKLTYSEKIKNIEEQIKQLELKYKIKDKQLLISQELKNSINSITNKIIKLKDTIKILEAHINNINQSEIGNNNNNINQSEIGNNNIVNINQNIGENENIIYGVPEELMNEENIDNEENEEFKNFCVEEI